jgi:hypothetical protein
VALVLVGRPSPLTTAIAAATLIDGGVVLGLLDAHGEVVVGGLLVGAAAGLRLRSQESTSAQRSTVG